ncbi:MAG: aminotransferase class III-fold pyridoxal phosphate-dependent enzyme, partial [Candidatus Binatia bacterium]
MQSTLLDTAKKYMPGATLGVSYLPEHLRMVMVRGQGCKVYDVAGKEYIDYLLGSGPLLLGHSHPAIVNAVKQQLDQSSTFYVLNEPAIRLAEKIVNAVPCGEAIRYQLSGTDATYAAIRIARAATGRDKVLKFEGGFHGAHDIAQISVDASNDKRLPVGTRDTDGIPISVTKDVVVAQFNDLVSVGEIVKAHHAEIAAIIVEPIQRVLLPKPGFLEGLRAIADEFGIVLIFDEIVTGFRIAWGGAQELYGVLPDLACYGKAIGGGYPIAAVVGRRELLE